MKKKIFSALACALVFSGCAPSQQLQTRIIDLQSTFSVDEVRSVKERGTATVTGEAFTTDRGVVVTCAGIVVKLVPVTEFSQERMFHLYNSKTKGYMSAEDQLYSSRYRFEFRPNPPEYSDYMIETICNSRGEFTFNNVSAGKYYLITRVVWNAGGGGDFAGGNQMQLIEVQENEVLTKIVSQ